MSDAKTERELLEAIDFSAANNALSGYPVCPVKIARYKAMVRGGITFENLFAIMAEDSEKALQERQIIQLE
jgi:hypothetical protein